LKIQGGENVSKHITVLVLDDEKIVCRRLEEYLAAKGMTVETFTDSRQAMARMTETHFDVVVTDLKMSSPDGMEILRFISDRLPSTQGILITAYGQLEQFREAQLLDVFEIVLKPFQMANLYKLIKKAGKQKSRKVEATSE
jgi:DNA-binding NtrC family response regulator